MSYIYRGDKLTDSNLKNKLCSAVRRPDGKYIRGKNGSMLVEFSNGDRHVIVGRRLKKDTSLEENYSQKISKNIQLIVFDYTNAYDIYSADALNGLGPVIIRTEMKEDGCHLYCNDVDPVVAILEQYGFSYEFINTNETI